MSNKRIVFIVLLVSALTHFIFFGHPNQTVFDEVHFGKFISGYYTHRYFFDIHPPLGKLIIAGFGKLFDFQPGFSFATIGDEFPDDKYKALRFLPSLAGTLLPALLVLLALELGFKHTGALTLGLLAAIEGVLLGQSRFILLDGFLLLFGFGALWCYFRWRNHGGKFYFASAGILGGLAMSVKWTGGSFLALMCAVEVWHVLEHRGLIYNAKHIGQRLAVLVVLPLLIYFGVFAVHFSLLTNSGEGDAFMTQRFQKTLAGNQNENDASLVPPNMVGKFVELNAEMYRSNQRLSATHPYSSQWYTWPFMSRPIYYWVKDNARIYLFGNPIVWWLSTVGVLMVIGYILTGQLRRDRTAFILLAGYGLNILPFIGIKRVMFLYHYLTALVFALLMLVYVIEKFSDKPNRVYAGLLMFSTLSFVYFAPLVYGLELSPEKYEQRVWLKSWK